MKKLPELFANNRRWAEGVTRDHPGFFAELAAQQAPKFVWIGCSDSRVPANEITGLAPGEMFVHRNIANQVIHTDFSCLSVLHFAIEVLRVEHVIVCGHYGCGGVAAALDDRSLGLIDNWLRHLQELAGAHEKELSALPPGAARADRLSEINAIEQALHVCQTTIVQEAWRRRQNLSVHAWIYRLTDGLLRDLGFCASGPEEARESYASALRKPE